MESVARVLAIAIPGWGLFLLGILAGLALALLLVRAGIQMERGRAGRQGAQPSSQPTPALPAQTVLTDPSPAQAAAPLTSAGALALPDHIMLVIAAAAAATFPGGARILSVSRRDPVAQAVVNLWSIEGRRQIYLSHQLR